MNMMATKSAWLDTVRNAHMSHPVNYTRGMITETMPASVSVSELEQVDQYGISTRFEIRDYIISAAYLGTFGEPKKGDLITDSFTGKQYIVTPAIQGSVVYSQASAHGDNYRIHTKLREDA